MHYKIITPGECSLMEYLYDIMEKSNEYFTKFIIENKLLPVESFENRLDYLKSTLKLDTKIILFIKNRFPYCFYVIDMEKTLNYNGNSYVKLTFYSEKKIKNSELEETLEAAKTYSKSNNINVAIFNLLLPSYEIFDNNINTEEFNELNSSNQIYIILSKTFPWKQLIFIKN